MEEQGDQDQARTAPKKRLSGRKVNLAFLVVIVAAVALIYWHQQGSGGLPSWPDDIDAALKQAAKEDRKVLVFLASRPPSFTDIRMTEDPVRHNKPIIAREKFITVLIQLDSLPAVIAGHKIEKLPTFLILGPDGKELNRRTGFVAPAAFGAGFLDCTDIWKPPGE